MPSRRLAHHHSLTESDSPPHSDYLPNAKGGGRGDLERNSRGRGGNLTDDDSSYEEEEEEEYEPGKLKKVKGKVKLKAAKVKVKAKKSLTSIKSFEKTKKGKIYLGSTGLLLLLVVGGVFYWRQMLEDFFIFPPTKIPTNVANMLENGVKSVGQEIANVGEKAVDGAKGVVGKIGGALGGIHIPR